MGIEPRDSELMTKLERQKLVKKLILSDNLQRSQRPCFEFWGFCFVLTLIVWRSENFVEFCPCISMWIPETQLRLLGLFSKYHYLMMDQEKVLVIPWGINAVYLQKNFLLKYIIAYTNCICTIFLCLHRLVNSKGSFERPFIRGESYISFFDS